MPAERAAARIELAIWLGLAALAFALTFEFSDEAGTYAWGAASWPRTVIALLALFAILQYAARPDEDGGQAPAIFQPGERSRQIAAVLLPLAYVFLLPRAGFHVTTPMFVLTYLLLLGERRPAALLGVPLVVFALVTLLFTRLFYVALPTGNWPGFYDVSNAFVGLIR